MLETLLQQARLVLENNWNGRFIQSVPGCYPHQWNWDAAFSAIGCAHTNMSHAETSLRHLVGAQWSNGMVPQAVFGEEADEQRFPGPGFWQASRAPQAPASANTSGLTMPPVFGFVLWRIYEIAQDEKRARAFLREMYPKVMAYHRYLYNCRDPLEEGLPYINHPWEGGPVHSPAWDGILESIDTGEASQGPDSRHLHLAAFNRNLAYNDEAIFGQSPFIVQDPLFNGLLAWSNECLIHIGALLKEDVTEAVQWDELTKYSINEKLWDESRGIYRAYDLRNQRLLPHYSSHGLMPLVGDVPTQEQAEKILLTLQSSLFGGKRNDIFLCPVYGLTGADVEPRIDSVRIDMNWLLVQGLRRYEMYEMAQRIRRHSLELLEQHGLYTHFSHRRGEAGGTAREDSESSIAAALCIDLLTGE